MMRGDGVASSLRVMLRWPAMMRGDGRMTTQAMVRRLPGMLGFQGFRHGCLLNLRHRESDSTDRPVADQTGHQYQ